MASALLLEKALTDRVLSHSGVSTSAPGAEEDSLSSFQAFASTYIESKGKHNTREGRE